MKKAERAELQRQGAKAAARGDAAEGNPMHARRNRPAATGESAQLWSARADAWRAGFDAQATARDGKPPLERDSARRSPKKRP